jgi:hypothetical protein
MMRLGNEWRGGHGEGGGWDGPGEGDMGSKLREHEER